jgi:stage V sporulation protein K
VIAAGYGQEMQDFISMNPGLRSRMSSFIEFKSYSVEEMFKIFLSLADDMEIVVSEDVESELKNLFRKVDYAGEMGNARFARELFATMCSKMNMRAFEDGLVELHEVTEFVTSDLPGLEVFGARRKSGAPLGFSQN